MIVLAHTLIGNILVYGGCLIGLSIALTMLFAPLAEEAQWQEARADEREAIHERGVAERRAIADAYIAASEARIRARNNDTSHSSS